MFLNKAAQVTWKWAYSISRVVNIAAMVVLIAMMLLTVADVILRYGFNRPYVGTFDITQFMMALMVFFGLAFCAIEGGHVFVDLVGQRVPRRVRAIMDSFVMFLSLILFAMISWQSILQGNRVRMVGETGGVTSIPVFPFVYLIAFGSVVLCFALLAKLLASMAEVARK